jgi:hypothetical protein
MTVELRPYLEARIASDGYRGIHVAQHNRLPEAKLVALLKAIHNVAGTSDFEVPPGDDPGTRLLGFNKYYEILDAIAASEVSDLSATFNSLKKNHFPNFESMGLLVRENRARNARLTQAAVEIINAGESQRRKKLIGDAMERMFGVPFVEDLHALLTKIDFLSLHEFMLIASDEELCREDKERLIRAYRRLKRVERLQLHAEMEGRCAQTMSLPKKDKRDWHNWWNEARQIVTMLATVPGFNVYNDEQVMQAGSSAVSLFLPTRSNQAKQDAFEWHGVEKRDGWEMHHVYPVEYATCERDMALIDAKENLLYIPAEAHRRIPSRGNRSVQLRYDLTHVLLVNPAAPDGKPQVLLAVPQEAAVKRELLSVMAAYSDQLLQSVA